MRGRAAPPHPRIYRGGGGGAGSNFAEFKILKFTTTVTPILFEFMIRIHDPKNNTNKSLRSKTSALHKGT